MTKKRFGLFAMLCLVAMILFSHPGQAARVTGAQGVQAAAEEGPQAQIIQPQTQAGTGSDEVLWSLEFRDADITQLIKHMSNISGKNFIVDRRVRGKIHVISPTKVTAQEAWRVFESVLEVNDFTLVESGEVIKVIPSPEARARDVDTILNMRQQRGEDRIVTQVVPLAYASPAEIQKIFQPLVSRNSIILPYEPTNTLIITDYHSNIQRLLKILAVIDVMGVGEIISVIALENAQAEESVKLLTALFQQKRLPQSRQTVEQIRMVADSRTNSIVLMASEVDTASIRELIKMLDRTVPRGKGRIRVYYLQNAQAEDVAVVLEKLSAGRTAQGAQTGEPPLISKAVLISPDKATNSLIIAAEPDDYRILEDVILKLDIPRAMVYIEALIMEVSTKKSFDLGVEWRAGDDLTIEGGRAAYFGGSGGGGTDGAYQIFPSPQLTPGGVAVNFPTGFALGIIGEAIKIGDVTFPNIGAVLRAYQGDSDVHILSAPQLLTTNNEQAQITVGKNVPYATRQETSSATLDYTTYEYKDVGIILKITPQISQERLVRLAVFQEVTRLITTGDTSRPTTFKRSTETTVVVQDGHTIVIGGLIDQSTEGGAYKVPCLGDIPLMGAFFRSITERRDRTNLYVFLTPHIIEQPSEARKIYEEKRDEIKGIEQEAIQLYKRRGDLNYTFDSMTLEDREPAPHTSDILPPRGFGLETDPEFNADQTLDMEEPLLITPDP
ncbi:MAG: type II secretion system secretin GspD [Desulfatibacillaceae bacterium]|nr:type II secretion system secretin GspD [Desulfatibacillaceae bacterium]